MGVLNLFLQFAFLMYLKPSRISNQSSQKPPLKLLLELYLTFLNPPTPQTNSSLLSLLIQMDRNLGEIPSCRDYSSNLH